MQRDHIDFHAVRFEHEPIHMRLLNWARWTRSGRGHVGCAPMFRLYRSTEKVYDEAPAIPVDSLDGHRLEQAVAALPEKHMGAIRWFYVYSECGVSVYKACRALAVRQDTLHQLVNDGRSMLRNRGA